MSTSTQALYTLIIVNQTTGYITYNGFTNGVASPPVNSGNPPLLTAYVAPGATATLVQAAGGAYWPPEGYGYVYPNTTGQITLNLPDASVLTVYWDVPANNGTSTFKTPSISSPTSYEVEQTTSGGTQTLTIVSQS